MAGIIGHNLRLALADRSSGFLLLRAPLLLPPQGGGVLAGSPSPQSPKKRFKKALPPPSPPCLPPRAVNLFWGSLGGSVIWGRGLVVSGWGFPCPY